MAIGDGAALIFKQAAEAAIIAAWRRMEPIPEAWAVNMERSPGILGLFERPHHAHTLRLRAAAAFPRELASARDMGSPAAVRVQGPA